MYSVGQMVVYGPHGVCKIIDECPMRVDKKKVDYFVLEPVDRPGARYYIPAKNDAALAKLSPVLSKDELDRLLSQAYNAEDIWVADENHRKALYRDLMNKGDRVALLCMIRSLYAHKRKQLEAGRKFHLCDENFLNDAEKLLSTEFALVLNIPPNEVGIYIQSRLNSL